MRKLLSMTALAACLCLSVTPVHAADAPAPAAISPAKQALLVRLDKAMNFEAMIDTVTNAAMKGAVDSMRQIVPEMKADQAQAVSEAAMGVTKKYAPMMKEISFQAYAETLSDAELTAMVEFYESPEGHAILEKLPQITQLTMTRMADVTVQMQKEMIAAMCEKTTCPQSLKDRVK